MTNPNFTPETSTNQIFRDIDDTRCLTDDLDAIEDDIDTLQTSKANVSHTHDYASSTHIHEQADITGLTSALSNKANADHTHNAYASATHTHNYASSSHSHSQADVTGLSTALAGKADSAHTHSASDVGAANSTHTHAQSDVTGLSTALSGKANTSHTHAQTEITNLTTALAAKADLVDGKIPENQLPSFVDDVVEYSTLSAFPTSGESGKIYVSIDTNKTYRWSGSTYVEISASIALGETSATAYRGDQGKIAYDHSQNTDAHVTTAQKTTWNAKQNALTFDTTPTASSTNPVTSGGIKTALDGKASSSHTHVMSAISGLLDVLMTDSIGGVLHNVTSGDMLSVISGWQKGMYTAYFLGGTAVTSIPNTSESWRCMVHKTGAAFGWVLAFGTAGSVYSNYLDNGTWKGWKAIYNASPAPLWGSSGYYMTAGHTVTPTKKLSECQHGWMLLWSDYDPSTNTTNEKDFWATMIPKYTPSGGTWNNKLFYCDIPRYIGDDLTDMSTEKRVIKQIYVSDYKLVGHDSNNKGERTDVVLRAVYEF